MAITLTFGSGASATGVGSIGIGKTLATKRTPSPSPRVIHATLPAVNPQVVHEMKLPAHRWQAYALGSATRDTAILAGIRGGKTVVGAVKFLKDLSEGAAGVSMISGPDLPMIRQTTLETVFRGMGPRRLGRWPVCPACGELACRGSEHHLAGKRQGDCPLQGSMLIAAAGGGLISGGNEIRFRDGNKVLVRPGDRPDHLRGPALKSVWVDEFTYCRPDMLPIIQGRTLDTGGKTIWTGTPKGKNWFWRDVLSQLKMVVPGRVWGDKRWTVVRYPTSENPGVNREMLSDLSARLPEKLRKQELGGEIVEWGGAVYPQEAIDRNLALSHHYGEFRDGHTYVLGVDPAGHGRDWWAVVVLCARCRCVVDLWRLQKSPSFRLMYRQTAQMAAKWKASEVWVDETSVGGQAILEELQEEVHRAGSYALVQGYTFTKRSKFELLTQSVARFEEGIGLGPDTEETSGALVGELRAYEWEDEDLVTDCVMAFALACKALLPIDRDLLLPDGPIEDDDEARPAYKPVDWRQGWR